MGEVVAREAAALAELRSAARSPRASRPSVPRPKAASGPWKRRSPPFAPRAKPRSSNSKGSDPRPGTPDAWRLTSSRPGAMPTTFGAPSSRPRPAPGRPVRSPPTGNDSPPRSTRRGRSPPRRSTRRTASTTRRELAWRPTWPRPSRSRRGPLGQGFRTGGIARRNRGARGRVGGGPSWLGRAEGSPRRVRRPRPLAGPGRARRRDGRSGGPSRRVRANPCRDDGRGRRRSRGAGARLRERDIHSEGERADLRAALDRVAADREVLAARLRDLEGEAGREREASAAQLARLVAEAEALRAERTAPAATWPIGSRSSTPSVPRPRGSWPRPSAS